MPFQETLSREEHPGNQKRQVRIIHLRGRRKGVRKEEAKMGMKANS